MLLEVVVALAVLTVGVLAVAAVLGAASSRAAAAVSRRAALEAAAEVVDTLGAGVDYPSGWHEVGRPGADRLAGTDDDVPDPSRFGTPCWMRTAASSTVELTWLWVEAECGSATRPDDRTGGGDGGRGPAAHGPRGSMPTVQRVRLAGTVGPR